MEINSRIFVAGHAGMVGSAIVRFLKAQGYTNIIIRTRTELDLMNQQQVNMFFEQETPEFVFLASAKVGGILANNIYKADFIYNNLIIASNIIHGAWKYGVTKLINLASSCMYPKFAKQPIKEEYLLTDVLESTNEPYAIAKIAALKLCRYFNEQYDTNFLSATPCNLYGIGDNFSLEQSHVLPALIRKFHEAKLYSQRVVSLWGDGSAEREFLFVDDLVEALVFLMNNISSSDIGEHINIGFGSDVSIKELAQVIKDIIGFDGEISWDTTKPNGTPKKLIDSTLIHKLGWKPRMSLTQGIQDTYDWVLQHYAHMRK